ncbi:MAG: hypothetical protein HRT35_27495, partial [Algicola sp.]|nr:hypothetical protein [Algicola sp.]
HRSARIVLAHRLWQKGLIHSEMDLIAQALFVVSKVIETAPSDTVYQLRAQLNLSMHRFEQARLDLLRVSKPSNQTQALLRQTALLAGNAVLAGDTKKQVQYPSTIALAATQASVHISNKNLKQAAALLAQAVDAIADTNPIPMVALHLIGAQLADAQGDKALATAHINRAVKRLPNHIGALEAKAALQQNAGQFKQAIACLSLAKTHSSDPHLTGLLASVYALNGNEVMAKRLDSQAIAQFRQALRKYPRAYAGEAAYYFAHLGYNHNRLLEAQKWAKFDVNNRPLHQQRLLLADIRQQLEQQ